MKRIYIIVAIILIAASLGYYYSLHGPQRGPVPHAWNNGYGAEFAEELAGAMQRLSFVFSVSGWVLIIFGGFFGLAAALLGSESLNSDQDNSILSIVKTHKGLACAAVAIVLSAIGSNLISRAKAAERTAMIATRAIGIADQEDRKAFEICVEAKALWIEDRMGEGHLELLVQKLNALRPESNGALEKGRQLPNDDSGEPSAEADC